MKHKEYVDSLIASGNLVELQLKAARATQEFDAVIATLIEQRALNLDTIADQTGIAADRLQDLLDGDSPIFEEVLLLCHALKVDVHLDSHFNVRSSSSAQPADPMIQEDWRAFNGTDQPGKA